MGEHGGGDRGAGHVVADGETQVGRGVCGQVLAEYLQGPGRLGGDARAVAARGVGPDDLVGARAR